MQRIAFHGSGVPVDSFRYEFTSQGNDQYGSGFYFTTDVNEAAWYAGRGGGEPGGVVHVARLQFDRLLDADSTRGLHQREAMSIMRASPVLRDSLMAWDDVDTLGIDKVLRIAAPAYAFPDGDRPLVRTLFALANDFFPKTAHIEAFNRAIRHVLSFDGVCKQQEEGMHLVAWFPEQIEICDRVRLNDLDCEERLNQWQAQVAQQTLAQPRRRR